MRHYLFQLPIIFLSEFSPSPSSARLALPAEACAPAGAAAAPPRSPRSGVKRSSVLNRRRGSAPAARRVRPVGCAPSGALHTSRTPVLIAIINRRAINAALSLSITYYISIGIFAFPKLRAARASCGSLRPCGRGGCAAPLAALGGRKPRCRKLLYHF